jgi:hypothetical protein
MLEFLIRGINHEVVEKEEKQNVKGGFSLEGI